MERWKTWTSLLFAVVLSLGMISVAAADPPDDHPACEKDNPPKGCEDDGHPGNSDDDDEGGDDPLAPLAEVCHQVVDALRDNVDPQLEQVRAVCDALGSSGDEDDDGDDGEEAGPTQPIADGCNQVVDGLVGLSEEFEQGRALCEQAP